MGDMVNNSIPTYEEVIYENLMLKRENDKLKKENKELLEWKQSRDIDIDYNEMEEMYKDYYSDSNYIM
jgi:hypothetical protein